MGRCRRLGGTRRLQLRLVHLGVGKRPLASPRLGVSNGLAILAELTSVVGFPLGPVQRNTGVRGRCGRHNGRERLDVRGLDGSERSLVQVVLWMNVQELTAAPPNLYAVVNP